MQNKKDRWSDEREMFRTLNYTIKTCICGISRYLKTHRRDLQRLNVGN